MNIIVSQLSLILAALRVLCNSCYSDIICNLVFRFLYSFLVLGGIIGYSPFLWILWSLMQMPDGMLVALGTLLYQLRLQCHRCGCQQLVLACFH